MVTKEKVYKLFDMVIDKQELTTKGLNEIGFTSNDIASLVKEGSLSRVKRGHYALVSVDELYNYGERLESLNDHRVFKCFKRCFQMVDGDVDYYLKLLSKNIKIGNLVETIKILDKLYEISDEFFIQDLNYYVFLLNIICPLPKRYINRVKTMTFDDIKILPNDPNHSCISEENTVRQYVFMENLKSAKECNKSLENNNGVHYKIQGKLIGLARKSINQYLYSFLVLAQNREYLKIKELLTKIESRNVLSKYVHLLRPVIDDILKIINTGELPVADNSEDERTIYGMIQNHDYQPALRRSEEHIEKGKINPNSNALHILLAQINELIQKKAQDQSFITTEQDKREALELIEDNLETVDKRGLLVLGSMSKSKAKLIKKLIVDFPGYDAVIMEGDRKDKVALRIKPPFEKDENYKSIFAKAYKAQREGDYDRAIELAKLMLAYDKPYPSVYSLLGFSYLKKNAIYLAIDYLTVSQYFNSKTNGKYDFTELLNKLKGLSQKPVKDDEESKPKVNMRESDFYDKKYRIRNSNYVRELVNRGVPFLEACHECGLDELNMALLGLLFAREYYTDGQFVLGDRYLKLVEKIKCKSPKIRKELDEVKRNKKFYQYRKEDEKPFVFKPKQES